MENKQLNLTPSGDKPAQTAKSPYEKPVLRIFGSVAQLTQGGIGSRCDNSKEAGLQNTSCL